MEWRLYKYLVVEHVLFVYMLAYSPVLTTQTQYIEERIMQQLGIQTLNMTRCVANKSSPQYEQMERVQKEASVWTLYLSGINALCVIFSSNILGSVSDKYGRYIALVVPCIGLLISAVINLLVVSLTLPLYCLFFGSLAQGIFGDMTTFLVGFAGYTSDATAPNSRERTVRFFLLDVIYSVGVAVPQYSTGFIIKAFGFAAVYLVVIGFVAITAFLIIFCVRDRSPIHDASSSSNPETQKPSSNPLNIFKNVYNLFHREKRRGWLLAGFNFVMCTSFVNSVSFISLSVLYTTGEPFCMGPVLEGYYVGTVGGVVAVGTLISGTILNKFLSKFPMMHLSAFTTILAFTLIAFAESYVMLYLGVACILFILNNVSLSRNSLANLVEHDEQGVVFAFSGCMASLCYFVSPIIYNVVYARTLHFMNGFVFLIMAGVILTGWFVIGLLHFFEPKQRMGYVSLNNRDEPEDC